MLSGSTNLSDLIRFQYTNDKSKKLDVRLSVSSESNSNLEAVGICGTLLSKWTMGVDDDCVCKFSISARECTQKMNISIPGISNIIHSKHWKHKIIHSKCWKHKIIHSKY